LSLTPPTTFVDLEFDTTATGTPLGDIAASLVNLHDLLRDLAAMAAPPSSAEFREIQVVAIEMRNPLTITLSLLAISDDAVRAFQDICRDVIARRPTNVHAAVAPVFHADGRHGDLTEQETARLHAQIEALRNAEVPLKRVVVTNPAPGAGAPARG
jgi:hypothetical protein